MSTKKNYRKHTAALKTRVVLEALTSQSGSTARLSGSAVHG